MGEEREGGTVEAEVIGATAEQVWSFLDFSLLDKVAPIMASCTIVEGSTGEPGCIRYCETKPIPSPAGGDPIVMRVKERLLAIDHALKTFSYEVTENNIGARGYIGNVKVYGKDEGGGCRIEWSFSAESFGVSTPEAVGQFLQVLLQGIVQSIEQASTKGGP
ncbi:lachrymatory-factor synthase-like [Wolffia australiana]